MLCQFCQCSILSKHVTIGKGAVSARELSIRLRITLVLLYRPNADIIYTHMLVISKECNNP